MALKFKVGDRVSAAHIYARSFVVNTPIIRISESDPIGGMTPRYWTKTSNGCEVWSYAENLVLAAPVPEPKWITGSLVDPDLTGAPAVRGGCEVVGRAREHIAYATEVAQRKGEHFWQATTPIPQHAWIVMTNRYRCEGYNAVNHAPREDKPCKAAEPVTPKGHVRQELSIPHHVTALYNEGLCLEDTAQGQALLLAQLQACMMACRGCGHVFSPGEEKRSIQRSEDGKTKTALCTGACWQARLRS